ncbi:hypothetical protein OAJ37_00830 [Euryarchaeota archaeon]|nr:hypothetical protein [Euryarchaeota archaeon]
MKTSDEWWNSDASEEQNNHDLNLTKPPKHFVEEKKQEIVTLNFRSKEIVFSSAMFLIGIFFAWDYWGNSGFSYMLNLNENILWFIDFNKFYAELSLLQQLEWLIFILSPSLLSINFIVMWYYLLKKKIDIGNTTSYIHFSIFITIIVTQSITWGYLVFPFDHGMGFNIILLSGLGLNQNTASKISERIYDMR